MKILQIINSLGTGGAEKLLLDLLPKYNAQGIQMDILLLWNNDHQFTNALQELDCCKVYILSESLRVKDVYKLSHIFKMKSIMKDYDIAHVHLFPAQYFAVAANMLNGNKTKLVFTEHNTTNSRISKSYFKPLESFVYRRYQRLVCISPEIENIYKKYLKFPNEYYQIIENGVDLTSCKDIIPIPRSAINVNLSESDKLLVQVAGFRKQKDQDTVICALAELPEEYKLVLVGDGERRTILENLVNKNGLAHRVFFLGQRTDVLGIIKSCYLAIMSSHYEGFGIAALESMACGIPTVASNVKGLANVVQNGGVLFETGNVKELVTIIKKFDDSFYYQSISENGIKRSEQYGINKMIQKHIELYRELYNKN